MSEAGQYDPEARRDTPLARRIVERIRRAGPMSVQAYVSACLGDPEHGYYRTRQAVGGGGDFVTAPEISQVFGELIGLWCVVVWQQMGAPERVGLVEVGPGRGTLLADALRAVGAIAPRFRAAVEIELVEVSPELRRAQMETLAAVGVRARWHEHLAAVPAGPAIVVANELLDALPVEQYVRRPPGWRARTVGLDEAGRLAFGVADAGPLHFPRLAPPDAPVGSIVERRTTMDMAFGLARLARGGPVAGLFVDYGHAAPGIGDTLQAVRRHRREHPLTSPGEADLTAHVDFMAFADSCRAFGLEVDGPLPQAAFLGGLGVMQRASRLMAANPARAAEIEAGVARLMSPTGMGARFQAIGVRSRGLAALPGLQSGLQSGLPAGLR